jgi:hypothetical protein
MYRRGLHLPDFREIRYWGLLWTPVGRIQICLKSGKVIVHIIWRPKYVLMSLPATLSQHNSAYSKRMISVRLLRWPRRYKRYANASMLHYTYFVYLVWF